jgi:thioredoxin reductase (NADPH)
MAQDVYDLIIIGGGPAGLTAGIYAARARLKAVLMEKAIPGGQVLLTDVIENYPGFKEPVRGTALMDNIIGQAKNCGLKIVDEEVLKISKQKDHSYVLECASKNIYKALALIIATGANWRKLGVPGEEALRGKGVSYCATCDGPLFKGRDVVVIGGGDKALEESLFLAKMTKSVKLIHRRDRFRAVRELQERVAKNRNITPIYDSVVTHIGGEKTVDFVKVMNKKTNKTDTVSCGGVFIFIGIEPNTKMFKGMVNMDERGFLMVDGNMKTSLDGVYACGDVIKKDLYQVTTAVGEGATAAFNAERYLEGLK